MYHIHYYSTTFDLKIDRQYSRINIMDDMIFGDTLLPIPRHPKADRLRENAATYANLLAKSEEVKISLDYLKAILLGDLPQEAGEYPIEMDDGRTLMIKVPEKWSWDKKLLKDTFESAGLPECVNQSFLVDRKKYEAAPDNVKEVLKQALTIECGSPTIKVQT